MKTGVLTQQAVVKETFDTGLTWHHRSMKYDKIRRDKHEELRTECCVEWNVMQHTEYSVLKIITSLCPARAPYGVHTAILITRFCPTTGRREKSSFARSTLACLVALHKL